MARRNREDEVGAWHHVMNRGIARRVVFEDKREARTFLALLAWQVRAGTLEVHAYSLMATHFHLLVRSPLGQLSECMQRVSNSYVRWYNRKHRRDGALFRGRFVSRPVRGHRYRQCLVRYIDQNPVDARICEQPTTYPFGSARALAIGPIPPWLATSWIEPSLAAHEARGTSRERAYQMAFGAELSSAQRDWIERTQVAPSPTEEEWALFEGAPEAVRNWMVRKASLADGVRPGAPLVDIATVEAALAGHEAQLEELTQTGPFKRASPREVIRATVLRELCGLGFQEVAVMLGISLSTAQRRYGLHRREAQRNELYASVAAAIAHDALRNAGGRGKWEL